MSSTGPDLLSEPVGVHLGQRSSSAGLCKAFLTKEQLQQAEKQHHSGLCPGDKQENGPKWRRPGWRWGLVSAPQMALGNHGAPRVCPSFRSHL